MIQAEHINVSFKKENQTKIFGTQRQQVLFDVNLQVERGSCLGILGESGSGKSTLGKTLCGLLKPDSGNVEIYGMPVWGKRKPSNKTLISIVFQDYTTSANPRFHVNDILRESLRVREKKESIKLDLEKEISQFLELVGLDSSYGNRFPHELSGGQLQRVCIARAIAVNPEVILFDEAISSLDAHTQVQIMDLLKKIQKEKNLTYLFITHDLTSITYLCDQVLFLYQGKVVENIPVNRISEVQHPYAKKLLNSVIDFADTTAQGKEKI